jgi:hypothetical protein
MHSVLYAAENLCASVKAVLNASANRGPLLQFMGERLAKLENELRTGEF